MPRVAQNLRSEVVRCTTECVSLLTVLKNFSQTEISEAEVTVLVHQNVLWLEIAVNNLFVVEISNSEAHLHGIKSCILFREAGHLTEMREELSSTDESHHEEDLGLGLENEIHSH